MTNTLSASDNGTSPDGTLPFQETARTRRSYRGFLDKVVPDDVLDAVLQDAPQVALLFMPSFGDNVRTAGDIGMYGQTFLLSPATRGLGGIPQTSLGFYAGTIREVLGILAEMKMLFGMSFGYPDEAAPGNRMRMDRVPVADSVHFHG